MSYQGDLLQISSQSDDLFGRGPLLIVITLVRGLQTNHITLLWRHMKTFHNVFIIVELSHFRRVYLSGEADSLMRISKGRRQ